MDKQLRSVLGGAVKQQYKAEYIRTNTTHSHAANAKQSPRPAQNLNWLRIATLYRTYTHVTLALLTISVARCVKEIFFKRIS